MITQETIDLVKGYATKNGIPEHCKDAAMNILRSEMPYLDMPPQEGEYKSRLFTSEAELLVEAMGNKFNLAKEREQELLNQVRAAEKAYEDQKCMIVTLNEQNRDLCSFIIDIISTGAIGVH